MKFQGPRGADDVLPNAIPVWRHIEDTWRRLVTQYGYLEVRPPMFESYDLFVRSSGETSDIVSKEMYDFTDKGGRHMALRPELTASVVRAYLEHSLGAAGGPVRLWYCGPIFRYGRPGKGRYRQFHQVGLEVLGSPSPAADAEVMEVAYRFYTALGLRRAKLLVNNIGRFDARERFGEAVLAHVAAWLADQTEEDRARAHKNPMRLLDSKDADLQALLKDGPRIADCLGDESRAHGEAVLERLAEAGVPFEVDPGIVRGLDYYTDTVFEVAAEGLGTSLSLCGGGRYDTLVSELGGQPTPAVGVAPGLERAILAMELEGVEVPNPALDAYLVAATEGARATIGELAGEVRAAGFACLRDLDGKSLKAQFKQADRSGARLALIVGDDELAAGTVTVRDLATGEQGSVPRSEAVARLKGL